MTQEPEEKVIDNNETVEIPETTDVVVEKDAVVEPKRVFQKNRRRDKGPRRDGRERTKPEFDQKIIQIRRVTRVTSGGRRMAFSVAMVIGDRKGKVGLGTGKGVDTAISIEKALRAAKKNLITVTLTKDNSIPHNVFKKFSSAIVRLEPAPTRGLIAGSAVRDVLDLCGVTNVNGKVLSPSKNKLNIAKATLLALSMLKKVEK